MGKNNHFMDPALYMKIINIVHVAVLAPLFIYVGIKGNKTPMLLFTTLLVVGVVVALYHSYRMFVTFKNSGIVPYLYVNLVHVLLVAPFLIYVGLNKNNSPPIVFHSLIIFAVLMILSNGYRLVTP